MFQVLNAKLIILVFLISSFCQGQRNNQDVCQKLNSGDSTSYICRKVNECPNARIIIPTGKAVLCGFENRVQKICCPFAKLIPVVKNSTTAPVTQNGQVGGNVNKPTILKPTVLNATNKKTSASIALEKCKEYHKAINVTKRIPGQFLGEKDTFKVEQDCHKIEELIVNGKEAAPKEFPHMALIGYDEPISSVQWRCGGSLISERFVLSAAHCGKTSLGEPKWVLLGDLNIYSTTDMATPQIYKIIQVINHPNYTTATTYNDISLFKLNATIIFTPFIRPICLFTSLTIPSTESKGSISGWGKTDTSAPMSPHLLKASIALLASSPCQSSYQTDPRFSRGFDSQSMICAGDLKFGNDTCGGDSGGPLQIPIRNMICMWAQIGITSIGKIFCGDGENPAIYTKVANYIDWIQPIVWP